MNIPKRRTAVLVGVFLFVAAATPARAAVDITGRWGVVVDSSFLGPRTNEWDIEQTGTMLTVTITDTSEAFLGYVAAASGSFTGTIDPDTGNFTVDLPDATTPFPFPPCPDSRIEGTATADSLQISGNEFWYFFGTTPTTFGCNNGTGPFEGVRCGPGVDACCPGPSCCGNGVVADGEECDDGNEVNGDCCSATCTLDPIGQVCSDNNACTDDLGCDGAGSCEHANNSAACGLPCRPGVCSGGLCNLGAFLPAGTPCEDGNPCTTGDQCFGTAYCYAGTAVTCPLPCQSCAPDTGCVAVPRSASACDTAAPSVLRLSAANSANSRVLWKRSDDLTSLPADGDPTSTAQYEICVFDAAGLLFGATAASGTCDGQPCWRVTSDGYRYRDPSAAFGLRRVHLRMSDPSFDFTITAKGPQILPISLATATGPLIAELRVRTPLANPCWQSRFDDTAIRRGAKRLTARN
jgi:cysteine-rich repeat protein